MTAAVPSRWKSVRRLSWSGLPSMPSISSWWSVPSSGGSVTRLLSKRKSSRRLVSMPSSAGTALLCCRCVEDGEVAQLDNVGRDGGEGVVVDEERGEERVAVDFVGDVLEREAAHVDGGPRLLVLGCGW